MNSAFRQQLARVACLLGVASTPVYATTYYVNSIDGNDSNSGQWISLWEGIKPWKTLAKVNATVVSGDIVKLGRGARWEETLQVKSGVTYESYGTQGNKPLITGAKSLSSQTWYKVSGTSYIYRTTLSGLNGQTIGQLFLKNSDGSVLRLQRARHPNVNVGTVAGNAPKGDFGANSRYFRIQSSPPLDPYGPSYLTMQAGVIPAGKTAVGAQAFVRNSTYVLLGYNVTQESGQTLTLAQHPMNFDCPSNDPCMDLRYEIKEGWGYWLENKDWMLDSPGEWYHDTSLNTLTVWMPNGNSPGTQSLTASVIDNGIVGTAVGNAIVRDIEVSETRSHAVVLKGSSSASVSGLDINRAGGRGLSFTAATGGSINNVVVQDSREDGIWMGDFRYSYTQVSSNVNLTNSTVRRSGRGYRALAGVMLGNGGTVSNNTVEDSSYIGIHAFKNSTISGNVVLNSCLDFDDCGGIYAIGRGESGMNDGYPLGLTINQNLVVNAPGQADGRADAASSTKGIYMDDYAQVATLTNNFVLGFDVGFHLHFARNLEVSGNKTFNNRVAELWMQENTSKPFECGDRPGCNASNYLMGNNIHHNAFATGQGNLIWQSTDYTSTSDFATFSNNSYASSSGSELVLDQVPGNQVSHQTLASWQSTGKDSGSTLYRTVRGYVPVAGAPNLTSEITFDNLGQSWGSYNGTRQLPASGCRTGPCLAITPLSTANVQNGRYVFLIHTANQFTVVPDKQYILSFDARTTNAGDTGYGVIRHGSTFGDVSSQGRFALDTTWQRYYRVLTVGQAAAGVSTRLDIEFNANGTVFVDNITLVEAQGTGGTEAVTALFNPKATAQSVNCPSADTAKCSQYVDVQTGAAISFPKSVPAKSAIIAVWKDSPWQDTDQDGVPNTLDQCPNTPVGRSTDATGCSI